MPCPSLDLTRGKLSISVSLLGYDRVKEMSVSQQLGGHCCSERGQRRPSPYRVRARCSVTWEDGNMEPWLVATRPHGDVFRWHDGRWTPFGVYIVQDWCSMTSTACPAAPAVVLNAAVGS